MTENQENKTNSDDKFSEMYSRFPDAEIKTILKKRDLYQPAAAKAAIGEAIKRGIINSEQDLLSEEYKNQPLRFSFFPVPENTTAKNKLRKSLLRTIFITGLMPVIQGAFKITTNEMKEAALFIFTGIIWLTFTVLFRKTGKNIFLILLYFMTFISLIYAVPHLMNLKQHRFMDIFVSGIVYVLVVYILAYARKLQKHLV